ncbi:MAG TPA: protease pro-enzyme activation domain-containing protein [Phenylobacterium sp.]|nr:protease pro-enzyme activation domain-containing protein [Phenylobacterium sp.]
MAERKYFTDSIVPLPPTPGITRDGLMVRLAPAPQTTAPLTLLFSLELPPGLEAELEDKVARGETVPVGELAQKYRAPAAEVTKLEDWLRSEGFEIVETTADGTGIYARGDVGRIEDSLQVTMVPVTKEGVTYMAAQDAPSLPSDVGAQVHAITGLQPFRHAIKHLRAMTPADARPAAVGPSPAIANAPPYVPSEILGAYGASGLSLTGAGQTIAILIDTFPADSDLQAFWRDCGLGVTLAQIAKINVGGGPLPNPSGEETLDASWTSGIAPGAQIRIYASGSLSFTALDRALDRIIADLPTQPGLRQLSVSLGLGETYMPAGEAAVQHRKFLRLAAAGVNVFVSTGDAGSNPDQSGHHPTGPLQAEYESTDPSVVAVGGTSLHLNPTGGVASETGWVGSGGGRSILFGRPAWQAAPGVPSGSDRLVPDVCAAADPNTGAFLVFQGATLQMGGTSWSAPVWAGLCALMNQAAANAGKPALPFLNPRLYPLGGTTAFRDIVAGSNGAYTAAPGYDMVTGLGAPNVRNLICRLFDLGPYVTWSTSDIGQGAGAAAWLTGDINGDGRAEVVQPWANGGSLGMIVYGWNGTAMSTLWSTSNLGEGPGAVSWLIGDINGDGKAEVVQLWANGGQLGMIVYGWNGTAMHEVFNNANMGEGPGAVSWQVGDINGDGKTELIQLWANGGQLGMIVYGWNGTAMREVFNNANMGEGPGAVAWQIADVNGDGKAELIQLWNNGGQLGLIEYGWDGASMREVFSAGDMGEGSGAVAWTTAPFAAGAAQLLQFWNNGGSLGAILYAGFN